MKNIEIDKPDEETAQDEIVGNKKRKHKPRFPFQILTKVVQPESDCPFQKRLTSYGVTDFKSYKKIVEELTNQLKSLAPINTVRAKNKVRSLGVRLAFLEKNKKYIREVARPHLDFKTYDYWEMKGKDFLYRTKELGHLRRAKGLIKKPWIFLFPNELHTEVNGFRDQRKVKSSSGKLILSKLRFFFVDIDRAESWQEVESIINRFGLKPDVVIQTSPNKFHCYWSIEHVDLDTNTEDNKGRQLDSKLILYELGLKALIAEFKADPKRSNASSQMRAPNSWNIKSNKTNNFKTKYWSNSRTLEDALCSPMYTFDQVIDYIQWRLSPKIYEEANSKAESMIRRPKEDTAPTCQSTLTQPKSTAVEAKSSFDFKAGWDDAFTSMAAFFGVSKDYFNENDHKVLKYIWSVRKFPVLIFSNKLRASLKGRGNRYAELALSLEKIAALPKKIGQPNVHLIKLVEKHQIAEFGQTGKRKGYQVAPLFFKAWGNPNDSQGIFHWIYNKLYVAGERNDCIPKDIHVLKNILNKSRDEAYAFLVDKIRRSANQENVELRCKNDISNVEARLRYYYK